MAKRSRHITSSYRSGLEDKAVAFLSERQIEVRYELIKIEWEDLKYRTYTPDFELDNGILIETKGYFDASDRRKPCRPSGNKCMSQNQNRIGPGRHNNGQGG